MPLKTLHIDQPTNQPTNQSTTNKSTTNKQSQAKRNTTNKYQGWPHFKATKLRAQMASVTAFVAESTSAMRRVNSWGWWDFEKKLSETKIKCMELMEYLYTQKWNCHELSRWHFFNPMWKIYHFFNPFFGYKNKRPLKTTTSRWFNSWPFHPLVRGHNHPLKGSRITIQ